MRDHKGILGHQIHVMTGDKDKVRNQSFAEIKVSTSDACHHPSCLLQSGSRGQPQGSHRPHRDHSPDKAASRRPPPAARGLQDDWKRPDLHSQFELFSKFANAGSDGTTITLRKVLSLFIVYQALDMFL